jgi:glutamine amidotransferase-like uncharacterized protein
MKVVFVYSGPGVCRQSLVACRQLFSLVEQIGPADVIRGEWMASASLFVLPGGADLPYCQHLNGDGNRIIRSFIEAGGRFLGICAGGYYAGSFVEYAKGTEREVVGKRELSFFPGRVCGPTIGMEKCYVTLSTPLIQEEPLCYYDRGGHFCLSSAMQNVEVLARYREVGGAPAAVVYCSVGEGAALLSGVHVEYDAQSAFTEALFERLGPL